jgi:hypothetical protein
MQIPYKGNKTLVTVKLADLVRVFQNSPEVEVEVAKKWVLKYNDMFTLVSKLQGKSPIQNFSQPTTENAPPKRKRGRPAKIKPENQDSEENTIEYNEIK